MHTFAPQAPRELGVALVYQNAPGLKAWQCLPPLHLSEPASPPCPHDLLGKRLHPQ